MIYIALLCTILLIYLLIILGVYYFQTKLIFFPTKLREDYKYQFEEPFQEFWIEEKDIRLNGLLFLSQTNESKGCVLYHHGNSRNIQHWASYSSDFTSRGWDVFFYDYRGFGKSTGKMKENFLYKDSKLAYNFIKEKYPKHKIIQYGRSLGTALATRLAKKHPETPLLILETPYFSMSEMARLKMPFLPTSLILTFKLRQDIDIKKVKCPITIFSGTHDELTPHIHSHQLQALVPKTSLIIIENGTHNDLPTYTTYQNSLDRLLYSELN